MSAASWGGMHIVPRPGRLFGHLFAKLGTIKTISDANMFETFWPRLALAFILQVWFGFFKANLKPQIFIIILAIRLDIVTFCYYTNFVY